MIRRTLILAALALLLASGAMAQRWNGNHTVILKTPRGDTADFLDESGTACDDSLDYSVTFETGWQFSWITGQIVQTVLDGNDSTGFAADSVDFKLQTKMADDSATVWWTIWTSGLQPIAGFDSTAGYGRGAGGRVYVPPDSMTSMGEQFRVLYHIVTPRDSIISAAALGYGTYGDSTTVDPAPEWEMELKFRRD